MPSLAVVLLLALAAFRVTRLFAADTITVAVRDRLFHFAYDDSDPEAMAAYAVEQGWPNISAIPRAPWRTWLYALYTCQHCLGVWISIAAYCAWRWGGDVALGIISVAAIAGAQSALVAALRESDDE